MYLPENAIRPYSKPLFQFDLALLLQTIINMGIAELHAYTHRHIVQAFLKVTSVTSTCNFKQIVSLNNSKTHTKRSLLQAGMIRIHFGYKAINTGNECA